MADIVLLTGSEELPAVITKVNEVITALNALSASNATKATAASVTTLSNTVTANKTAVEARVLALEKHEGMHQEDHTPAAAPTVPEDSFNIDGDTNDYKFTVPNFYHKGQLYSAEEVMEDVEGHSTLLVELVANQYEDETFVPGLLEIVEA